MKVESSKLRDILEMTKDFIKISKKYSKNDQQMALYVTTKAVISIIDDT